MSPLSPSWKLARKSQFIVKYFHSYYHEYLKLKHHLNILSNISIGGLFEKLFNFVLNLPWKIIFEMKIFFVLPYSVQISLHFIFHQSYLWLRVKRFPWWLAVVRDIFIFHTILSFTTTFIKAKFLGKSTVLVLQKYSIQAKTH